MEMSGLIKSIVLISFDIDLTQLDPDVFRKEKELDRCIAGELFPNRIFRNTARQVRDILCQDAAPEIIQKALLDLIVEREPVCSEENLRIMQDRHRGFFKKLYQDSPNYPVLVDILTEFNVKAMDPVDILGSGIPTASNPQYPLVIGSKEEIIRRSEKDVGVLYILGERNLRLLSFHGSFPLPSSTSIQLETRPCLKNVKAPSQGIFFCRDCVDFP